MIKSVENIEIEYNCEEETDQKVASVTALNLIEN